MSAVNSKVSLLPRVRVKPAVTLLPTDIWAAGQQAGAVRVGGRRADSLHHDVGHDDDVGHRDRHDIGRGMTLVCANAVIMPSKH